MNDNPVLDRLVKLMNLADRATGHEAEVAAMRASEFMAKHQISVAEIESHNAKSIAFEMPLDAGRIDGDVTDSPRRAFNSWKGKLSVVVANGFGGRSVRLNLRTGGFTIVMVGPADSVASARYLFMALERQLERMVRQFLKATGGKGPQGNAYLFGAVDRIDERMREARDAAMGKASVNALAVIDKTKARIDAQVANTFGDLKKSRGVTLTDAQAKRQGYVEAGDLDIGMDKPTLGEGKKELN